MGTTVARVARRSLQHAKAGETASGELTEVGGGDDGVAKAAALIAANTAVAEGRTAQEVLNYAAEAAKQAGASPEETAKVVAAVANTLPEAMGKSPEEVEAMVSKAVKD